MSTFARLGYWAAVACGVAAVAYGVVSLLVAAVAPAALTWESYEQFTADYRPWPTMAMLAPPFVVTVVFPVLVLAVYATVDEKRRPFALLALVFAGVYSAVLGAAYWLQLTNVPWNIVRGASDGIAPWVVWNPASFFWSLETFAYFALGLSCVCAALAYERGVLPRRVRGGLLAMGVLGVWFLGTALKDVVFNSDAAWVTLWSLSAFLSWVVLFSCVAFGLAGWFARAGAAARNYETYDLTCDELGNITIEVVNRGHWGTAKVQGTNLTLIQSWATLTVTPDGSDTVVYEERHAKGNDDIDDICRRSWTVEVTEDDPTAPPGFPPGSYLLEHESGVKVRGR